MGVCDEWGGAESRGNGARPVEWMIMNDTCATHRSRVPRRSFGRNKRRSDDIGRRERTRPGFYFMFCVWQSSVRGCRFSVMFVYFVIKMCLNVRRFPPPSSRTYQLRYIYKNASYIHTKMYIKSNLKQFNIRQQHNKMWKKLRGYEYFRKALYIIKYKKSDCA